MFKKEQITPFIKPLIITLTVLIILSLGGLIVLKNIFSYSFIEKYLSDFSGLKVEFINPKTTLDYHFNINAKADFVNIYNDKKTSKFASIEHADIKFKPLNLIFNKANFKNLSAKSIVLNIKRDKNGKIDLLDSIKERDWSFFQNNKLLITKLDSKIDKIEMTFLDEYIIKSSTKIILNDTDINISKKHKNLKIAQHGLIETTVDNKKQTSNISINIASLYPINNFNSENLNLDIDIDNINLFIFSDIFKNYISKEINLVEGNANLTLKTNEDNQELNLNILNPTLKLKDKKIISPFKKGINIKTLFTTDKKTLLVNELSVLGEELSVKSKGEIIKPFSKNPSYNFQTQISNTQINNLLYFLPDNLIYYRPKGIPTLKKSNFHGVVDGNINLKLFPLDITGNLKASNVHIPNYPKPYRQNDVNAIFMKDKMRIYTRVYTPDNEYVTIDGVSNLDDSLYGKYNVTSTPKIDLKFAQMYLVPIQQIIGFNIGPVPIMDITGYGNIDIKTQGTLSDAQIFGEFNAYNATASIDGLAAKLTNGDCKLVFEDRNLIFKEIKGKMGTSDFLLTGIGNTKGEVDLNVKLKNAATSYVVNILNNSLIGQPYKKLTKNIAALSGGIEADINLKGIIKDYENAEFLNGLNLSGVLKFKNNKVILNNKLSAKNITGVLNFGAKQSGMFEAFVNNSKFNIQLYSKDSLAKIINNELFEVKTSIFANKIAFKDITGELMHAAFLDRTSALMLNNLSDVNFYTKLNLNSTLKLSMDKIDFNSMKNQGYIIGLNDEKIKDIKFNSGIIKIDNNKLNFNNFDTTILNGSVKIKGNINNFLTHPMGDMTINFNNISLEKLNGVLTKINPKDSLVKTGQIIFKNDTLKLNGLSLTYNSMPLYINALVKNIYDKKAFDADFSTILNEQTADSIINPYLTYPVNLKGEIPIKGNFKGDADNYLINFTTSIPKNSDISFYGANIGDIDYKREITGKIEVNEDTATLDNLRLIKYIANQNGKVNPITTFKVDGKAVQKGKDIYLNNFKIATLSPVNVRILNLIFKKSLLKKGNFECNFNLNGNIKTPKINGKINLEDLDIPLYDTQINNIKVNISNNFIDGIVLAKNKQSDLKVIIKALNKFETPYIIEKIDISSNKLNILDILMSIPYQTTKTDINAKPQISIKPQDVIIKDGSFDFREVTFDKINAQNLNGNFDYENNIFNLKDIVFDIAEGKISGSGKYSLKSTRLDMNAKMDNCDSNILAKEFLKLPNQIFGKMDGSLKLSAKNLNTPDGIKNINSHVDFSINNGKMPKLGSLEYLLRAGNLIKNGILGLSLNNLIQVLTPYKTGEFEQISGSLDLTKGEVKNLEIFSKGKNLSLYLNGSYSILENFSDIKIYGKLSQNISNALGALGNASLKQFINSIASIKKERKDEELVKNLNKIPSIEIENPEPRYFRVNVSGDINKENYIKSFRWE